MKLVSVSQMTALGKSAIGLILAMGALLQIPDVSAFVGALVKLHPHISTLVGMITTIAALFANPQVQTILGFQQEVKTPEGTVTTTITATSPEPKQ